MIGLAIPGALVANPLSARDARLTVAGGRLVRVDATTLRYARFSADAIEIEGEYVTIDATSGIELNVAANLITAAGADAAAPPTADAVYFAYISRSTATFAPLELRLCATAPSRVDGIKYLATSGNGARWRFVGLVYVDPSSEFVDLPELRGIANEANRLVTPIATTPEYLDNNAETTYAFNSATWAPVGNGATISFCSLGEDATVVIASVVASLVGAVPFQFGALASYDGGDVARTHGKLPAAGAQVSSAVALSVVIPLAQSQGLSTVSLVALSGGVATTLVADGARNGLAADPPMTGLRGFIMA